MLDATDTIDVKAVCQSDEMPAHLARPWDEEIVARTQLKIRLDFFIAVAAGSAAAVSASSSHESATRALISAALWAGGVHAGGVHAARQRAHLGSSMVERPGAIRQSILGRPILHACSMN